MGLPAVEITAVSNTVQIAGTIRLEYLMGNLSFEKDIGEPLYSNE